MRVLGDSHGTVDGDGHRLALVQSVDGGGLARAARGTGHTRLAHVLVRPAAIEEVHGREHGR